mmetsp:Transcript_11604/g.20616  ORF Transcript_11604/g.20616 Transcript_11604/m.20616 type:complete len:171 (-) Transcript_11604:1099-1611(-)
MLEVGHCSESADGPGRCSTLTKSFLVEMNIGFECGSHRKDLTFGIGVGGPVVVAAVVDDTVDDIAADVVARSGAVYSESVVAHAANALGVARFDVDVYGGGIDADPGTGMDIGFDVLKGPVAAGRLALDQKPAIAGRVSDHSLVDILPDEESETFHPSSYFSPPTLSSTN